MASYWFRNRSQLTGPISPLARTVLLPAVENGMLAHARTWGREGGSARIRVDRGYVYLGWEDVDVVATVPKPDPARVLAALAAIPSRWQNEWLPEILRLEDELRALVPPGADAETARRDFARATEILRRLWIIHFETTDVFGGFTALAAALRAAGERAPEAEAGALLAGVESKTSELDGALLDLGALVADDPELLAILDEGTAHALVAALERDDGEPGRRFRALWPELRERVALVELFAPTWGEDPAPLARALAGGAAARDAAVKGHAAAIAHRDALERAILARAPPEQTARLRELVDLVRRAWPLFETHHYYIDDLAAGLVRLVAVRVGGILAAKGVLADAEEIVFLERGEIERALAGERLPRGLVEQRRRERDAAEQSPPPEESGELPAILRGHPWLVALHGIGAARPAVPQGGLAGVGASPGRVAGPARVARGVEDLEYLAQGEILVAGATEPTWTTAMARASALVTESGGVLSHAAVVARELGVPAVVGAKGALRVIATGDHVEVDGDSGEVTIIRASAL